MHSILPPNLSVFETSLKNLQHYVEKEAYKGYDPYDTLNSFFPFKYFGRWVPVLALQFQKRNPLNIRPILGIKKSYNPKALGLFLYSYSKLQTVYPDKHYKKQADFLFQYLQSNYSKGFSGHCWGYNFDWASKEKYIRAYSPNIVVTAFVAKGVFEYYKLSKSEYALNVLKSICDFILNDLPKTETDNGVCFSYTTQGVDRCYNASLLAALVLSQLFSITKNQQLKNIAISAVNFVISKQHPDGHWNYSIDEGGNERVQIDFHQGYVVDCIFDIMNYCQIHNDSYNQVLIKGANFYYTRQFFKNGQSKWRLPKEFPVEIHNQSQGIISFTKLAHLSPDYMPFAQTIANWTITNMQHRKGYFFYRKLKTYTNKISFMRWSQAWMFVALTDLVIALKQNNRAS